MTEIDERQETFIKVQNILIDENIISSNQLLDAIKPLNIFADRELFLHFLNSLFHCVHIRPKRIGLYLSIIFTIKDEIFQTFPLINCYDNPILSEFFNDLKLNKNYDENKKYQFLGMKKHQDLLQLIIDDKITEFQDYLSKTNLSIDTKIDVKQLDIKKFTSLSLIELASLFGSVQIFKFLLLRNATIKQSLAYFVLAGGNYDLIHLCESQDIPLTTIDAIPYAIQYWNNDIVDYLEPNLPYIFPFCAEYYNMELLFRSAKTITKRIQEYYLGDPNFEHACFYSSKCAYFESLKILCQFQPTIIDISDLSFNYIIHYAVNTNIIEVIRFLCDLPNINLNVDDGFMASPLIIAVRHNNPEVVDLLCSYDQVDLNHQDYFGKTALFYAIQSLNIPIITTLLKNKHRIQADITDNELLTYMHAAISTKNLEIVKLIYEFDNHLCFIGNKTNTKAIAYSISYGTPEIVEFLLTVPNIEVNATNRNGIAALHLAVNDINKLQILCRDPKIDLNIKNDRGILSYFI